MLILAIIIYLVAAFGIGLGPLWPVEMLIGRAGCLGSILSLGWWVLLIKGFETF